MRITMVPKTALRTCAPETYSAAEVHRYTQARPMSLRSPMRPTGMVFAISCAMASSDIPGASFAMPAVPRMGPGATPLTRMPASPHSSASVRVTLSTAALAADACTCSHRSPTACTQRRDDVCVAHLECVLQAGQRHTRMRYATQAYNSMQRLLYDSKRCTAGQA